ncbi:hypothetical protein H6G89_00095 [Oscillatoria sp. FACHB-1407]|uniref:hypothetical protein n=1 Tax=Oscillatoria sp. FACHB-1407 TaxID=2692847 RepID=UPI001681E640|nr:hypothetical protein [Oscillatoria sp. FACHB-1407]MBD2459431.1 hypothetical protein [Oscillatoria sp. FACHB-1407]
MSNPWLNMALVLAFLLGLMVGLRVVQHRFSPHPEFIRKGLHIPMGLMTLTFPWLFDQPLPVFILAGLAIAWLSILRSYSPLKSTLGNVLGGVKRRSLGEIYFPISVALLFALSDGDPLLFCIPMLILTLADAVAAVVGVHYGKLRYAATDGQKSAEGSITFFMLAFFSVHVPLLLATPTGRAETLLIAMILGLLVMLLEAIAWSGLDNLFIPLGGFILLKTHLEMDVTALLIRFVVTAVLVTFVLVWRRRTTLNDSALLGTAFIGYLSWSLGGWQWLMAPLILLISYPFLILWVDQHKTPLTPLERQVMIWLPADPSTQTDFTPTRQWERVHNVYAVLSVAAGGLLWLALYRLTNHPELIYPYTLAFAANLTVICIAGLSPLNYWHKTNLLRVVAYVCESWLLMFVPLIVIASGSTALLLSSALSLLGIAVAAIAYYLTQPMLRQRPSDTLNWFCRAVYTTLGSCVVLLGLFAS